MLNLANLEKNAAGVRVFHFGAAAVRTVTTGAGDILFVAKDVCEVLGLANHRDAVADLDQDERADCVAIADAIGRSRSTTCVTESGLYALIFKSRKREAKAFRKWVTAEVLPALRKTGRFELPGAVRDLSAKEAQALMKDYLREQARFLKRGGLTLMQLFEDMTAANTGLPVAGTAARMHAQAMACEPIGEYLAYRLEASDDGAVPLGALVADFKQWCAAEGIDTPDGQSPRAMACLLRERGYPLHRNAKNCSELRGFALRTV